MAVLQQPHPRVDHTFGRALRILAFRRRWFPPSKQTRRHLRGHPAHRYPLDEVVLVEAGVGGGGGVRRPRVGRIARVHRERGHGRRFRLASHLVHAHRRRHGFMLEVAYAVCPSCRVRPHLPDCTTPPADACVFAQPGTRRARKFAHMKMGPESPQDVDFDGGAPFVGMFRDPTSRVAAGRARVSRLRHDGRHAAATSTPRPCAPASR